MPDRWRLGAPGVGRHGRELVLAGLLVLPLLVVVGRSLGVEPLHLFQWQPLPPFTDRWPEVLALPWVPLLASTLGLTLLAAALALGFHNLGILGRLLLEAAESTAMEGRSREEALIQAGIGHRLALLYGRFSCLARTYLAYGAYRTDVILRETVVVGLVGTSGLGSQLQEALSAFAWHQLLALLVAYAALTLLGEDLSDRLRHRLLNR